MAYARMRDPTGMQDPKQDEGGRGRSAQRGQAWPNAATRSPGYVQAPSAESQVGAGAISRKVSGARRDAPAFPGLERKSWLKPVSSLLQGIPDNKRGLMQRDFRGVDHAYPPTFAPAVHPLVIQRERGESRFSQHEPFRGIRSDQHPGVDIVPRREATATATPQSIERLKYEQFGRKVESEAVGRGLHPRGARDGSFSPRFVSARNGYNLQSSSSECQSTTINDHFRHQARSNPDCNDPTRGSIAGIEQGVGRGLRPDSTSRDGDRVMVPPAVAPARDSLVDRSRANDNFNCVGQTSRCASHVPVARREAEIWHKAPIETASMTAATTTTAASRPAPFLTLHSDSSAGSPAKRSKEQQEAEGIVRRPPVSQTVKLGEKSPQAALDSRRRNRCLGPGCNKSPRYALPGQKAEYCSQHKMENYVDVKHPRCESELGCVRQPTFGWEGEKARFCSAHKVEGMLDVKNPRCAEPGCMKRPRYGDEGERARFCAAHKFDNMVDLATRRGAKCSSPAKRSRDGPRSFAHDFAAVSVPGTGSRRTSMPSFNLGTPCSAPAPKRGHTPAHAGGHRRATSESWIDFCPKRVFGTTVKHGVESHAAADGIESEIRARVPANVNSAEVNPDRRAPHGPTSAAAAGRGMGTSYDRRFTAIQITKNIQVLEGEMVSDTPAQMSPPTASPPCRSVPTMSRVSSSSASGAKPPPLPLPQPPLPSSSQKIQQKTQRFDAVDYEASAILLECRSGALLPRHLRARSP